MHLHTAVLLGGPLLHVFVWHQTHHLDTFFRIWKHREIQKLLRTSLLNVLPKQMLKCFCVLYDWKHMESQHLLRDPFLKVLLRRRLTYLRDVLLARTHREIENLLRTSVLNVLLRQMLKCFCDFLRLEVK